METKSLEYFQMVYREQNMHRAAEKLFISQQGLSRVIQNLEKELECRLFERDRVGMIPTAEGHRLYESAKMIQAELEHLRNDIAGIAAGRKTFHMSVSYGVLHLFYPALRQFSEKNPEYNIHWSEHIDEECERMLEDREVELALNALGEERKTKFEIHHLSTRRIMLLVYEGHPFYDCDGISVRQLKGERLITVGHGFRIFSTLQRACLDAGFYPHIEAEVSEINLCHKLVRMGEGVGLTVDFIADMVEQEGVRAIPLREECFTWSVGIVRNKKAPLSEGAQKFWNYMVRL